MCKKTINIWDANVDNIAISKLVDTKTNSKFLIRFLDKAIKVLVLVLPKMVDMLKHLKVKMKIIKLMSFSINENELLEKYQAIWTKIKDLKNIELNVLSVYDAKYIKTIKRTFRDKIYTNFRGLNIPEDDAKFKSFKINSVDSSLV